MKKQKISKMKRFNIKRFVALPSVVFSKLAQFNITREELMVVIYLLNRSYGQNTTCHPSARTIAKSLGYKVNENGQSTSVKNIIKSLTTKGIINVVSGKKESKPNTYDIEPFLIKCSALEAISDSEMVIDRKLEKLSTFNIASQDWHNQSCAVIKYFIKNLPEIDNVTARIQGAIIQNLKTKLNFIDKGKEKFFIDKAITKISDKITKDYENFSDFENFLENKLDRWLAFSEHLDVFRSTDESKLFDALAEEINSEYTSLISSTMRDVNQWIQWEVDMCTKTTSIAIDELRDKYFPNIPEVMMSSLCKN